MLRAALWTIAFSAGVAAASPQQVRAPRLPEPVRLQLPLNDRTLCNAARDWSRAMRVPVGVECRWDPGFGAAEERARVTEYLDLSGLDASESLRVLSGHLPRHTVALQRSFAVMRFTRAAHPDSPLDRIVPQFQLQDASLQRAADAVYALLNPTYRPVPRSGPVAGRRGIPPPAPAGHALTVDLANATVERILTTICERYGDQLSWRLAYLTDRRAADETLVQFFNASVMVTAGSNRVQTIPAR